MGQSREDQGQGPALSPAESSQLFSVSDQSVWKLLLAEPTIEQPLSATFDSRGRLWVVEYRQYPEPEGLKALSRDNFWRIVYDRMPLPPGHGGARGADRITIHEDQNGDGSFETHSTFVDGLNIATSVVPTSKGAWVLNPPYLLFFQDEDGDSQADGPPEVHLEGFGLEDTHSVVNSLCMGPDGWLYAAQGSTVTGAVKNYGSSELPIKTLGQAIWRYHPQSRKYEVFAEGGGNAFGVAMNDSGEIFSGHNGGDTRGFHYYQGGYYRKGFTKHGSLSNPNAFGYLNPMAHPPIQRFTHTMLMMEGTAFENQM
ncbi:MAG: PVC-type heme-binding CxxCH protein, partial [Pirellula staleyi]